MMRKHFKASLTVLGTAVAATLAAVSLVPQAHSDSSPSAQQVDDPVRWVKTTRTFDWWSPGEGRTFNEWQYYPNEAGVLGTMLEGGPLDTKGHAFFEPIGTNGRACVSCHQPEDGMGLSVASIQERWRVTQGKDPIFAAIDGKNCPHLPDGDPKSHSLLLNRGLFRVFLPWPPKAQDGSTIDPEFTIEVVRDPTGCNTTARIPRSRCIAVPVRPRTSST
jgi:hypothetical protein